MITPQGTVKVMDFGIARAVSDSAATMTSTAAVIGTAQYLSPEQARGEGVDARSDVYSLGCLLYELVTGAPPFTGDSPWPWPTSTCARTRGCRRRSTRAIPPELDAILLKAMSKNPANRYQSAADMRNDLLRALAGQRVEADAGHGRRREDDDPRRRPRRLRLRRRRPLGRRGRGRAASAQRRIIAIVAVVAAAARGRRRRARAGAARRQEDAAGAPPRSPCPRWSTRPRPTPRSR